jgi:hypothetical protein
MSLNDAKSALYMRLEECKNGDEPFCHSAKKPRLGDPGFDGGSAMPK